MSKMLEQYKAARRAGTPLIAIKTFDPEATMQAIQGTTKETPLIQWDCIRGWTTRNPKGQEAIDGALKAKSQDEQDRNIEETVSYSEHLMMALRLPYDEEATKPTNPVLFVLNAQEYFEKADFVQALQILRDQFKDNLRSIVLLGPDFNLPAALQQDILVLDEPLPTPKELEAIIRRVCGTNGCQVTDDIVAHAVTALRGLAAFPAEQAVAMSLTKKELNLEMLWERKRQMIKNTAGLSVWIDGMKFDDLGGLDNIKARFRRIIAGKAAPRAIVWIDEIEKFMNVGGSDTAGYNGAEKDQLGVLLGEMQDRNYSGVMFVGVPGAAKSAMAKAIGNEAQVLTIKLDLGGAKGGGLVGQAEASIRQAMKVINAVAGDGGAFFVCTSNDIGSVKPELKRRLKKGIWFFPLPTTEERKAIWDIWLTKLPEVEGINRTPDGGVEGVDDSNWTGFEIETCVRTADEESVSLQEAARDIIPVAVSGKEQMNSLYMEAHQRYNSVSHQGVFDRHILNPVQEQEPKTRRVAEDED